MFNVNQEKVSIETFKVNTITAWSELIKLIFNQVDPFYYCFMNNLEHISLKRHAFS